MSLARYNTRRPGASAAGWLGTLAVVALLAVGLWVFLSLPRVASVSPAPGAQAVSSLAPLRVTFTRAMDTASVESALALQPNLPGAYTWEANTLTFTPAGGWPLQTTFTVTLGSARGANGLPLLGARTWQFTVGELRLTYLAGSPPNLYAQPAFGTGPAQPLTSEPYGVLDYALSPDASAVVYAAWREDGGTNLRRLALDGSPPADLVQCPGEVCAGAAISPDGQWLAYQRHALPAGASRVVVRSLADGQERTLAEGDARLPQWATGGRLSYFDAGQGALVVSDLTGAVAAALPNAAAEPVAWAPSGDWLVLAELFFPPEAAPAEGGLRADPLYAYLARVDLTTGERLNLSGGQQVDDASPVLAPSGAWLAFGRRTEVDGQAAPGRQVWLMRPDGSEARALTADPLYNHSGFRFSPTADALAYARVNALEPDAPAEIWLVRLDPTGEVLAGGPRLVAAGILPEWLP